jgi:hypothetical protein
MYDEKMNGTIENGKMFYAGMWLDEGKVIETFNAINRAAKARAIKTLEFHAAGSRTYPFVLTPEQEAEIFIERYFECLGTGDTTTMVHAAMFNRPARLIAARAYAEWLKWA